MDEWDETEETDRLEERLALEQRNGAQREFNTLLKFWFACPKAACRRHRRCGGNVNTCRETFWPAVAPEIKAWWRALGDAAREGLPLQKANTVAADAVARWKRVQKRDARLGESRPGE